MRTSRGKGTQIHAQPGTAGASGNRYTPMGTVPVSAAHCGMFMLHAMHVVAEGSLHHQEVLKSV